MKNEEKLSNLLSKKTKKPRSVDKSIDSSVNIFPLKSNSLPQFIEQKEKPQKIEKKPDISAEFADLKQITKKYLDKIYSIKENNISNNTYNNSNVRIFHENPDYYSSNFQRINNINDSKSFISSKNLDMTRNLVQNDNISNVKIDKKTTDSSNLSNKIEFTKNNSVAGNTQTTLLNSNYSVKTPTVISKPVSLYKNLTENTVTNKSNTTFQSNKEPKRFQQGGINVIKLPSLPNPIPTFAEGGMMDVKGPQLIEVGSDKNNAPMMERIMAFSKPAQTFLSAMNPLNVGKNLSSLMKSTFGGDDNTVSQTPKSTALGGFIEKLKDSQSEQGSNQSRTTAKDTTIAPNLSSNNSNNTTTNIVSSNINTESTLQTVLRALDYGLRSRHKIG